MKTRLLVSALVAASVVPAAISQQPGPVPPGGKATPAPKVDPGEPARQPQVAHDHDGDGTPDHTAEEHTGGVAQGLGWLDGAVGPGILIVGGLAAIAAQRAASGRRRAKMSLS